MDAIALTLSEYVTFGCECCEVSYTLWFLSGGPPLLPPDPAEPKGAIYRGLMQCQLCFRSKSEGATFFRCGGCSIEIYCVSAHLQNPSCILTLTTAFWGTSLHVEQRVPEEGMGRTQTKVSPQQAVSDPRRRGAQALERPARIHIQAPTLTIRRRRRGARSRARPISRGKVRLRHLPATPRTLAEHRDQILRVRRSGRPLRRAPAGRAGGGPRAAAVRAQAERRQRAAGRDGGDPGGYGAERDQCGYDGLLG